MQISVCNISDYVMLGVTYISVLCSPDQSLMPGLFPHHVIRDAAIPTDHILGKSRVSSPWYPGELQPSLIGSSSRQVTSDFFGHLQSQPTHSTSSSEFPPPALWPLSFDFKFPPTPSNWKVGALFFYISNFWHYLFCCVNLKDYWPFLLVWEPHNS